MAITCFYLSLFFSLSFGTFFSSPFFLPPFCFISLPSFFSSLHPISFDICGFFVFWLFCSCLLFPHSHYHLTLFSFSSFFLNTQHSSLLSFLLSYHIHFKPISSSSFKTYSSFLDLKLLLFFSLFFCIL